MADRVLQLAWGEKRIKWAKEEGESNINIRRTWERCRGDMAIAFCMVTMLIHGNSTWQWETACLAIICLLVIANQTWEWDGMIPVNGHTMRKSPPLGDFPGHVSWGMGSLSVEVKEVQDRFIQEKRDAHRKEAKKNRYIKEGQCMPKWSRTPPKKPSHDWLWRFLLGFPGSPNKKGNELPNYHWIGDIASVM